MRWLLTFVMIGLAPLASAQEPAPLTSERDRLSYAMGMDLGHQLKTRSVEIDPTVFARGLGDALAGGKTLLTEDEAKAVISELQKVMAVKQAAAAKLTGDRNKAEGEAFLAANKAKDGVVTLPSGLQYTVVTPGSGKAPTLEDTVVCHYRLRLVGGAEVDSSYRRGQPITIPVRGAIKGWTEALQLMPVGSTWQLVVPSTLAYGERGGGTGIGPNATLVFEIELLAIK